MRKKVFSNPIKEKKFLSNLFCWKPGALTPVKSKCTNRSSKNKNKNKTHIKLLQQLTVLSMFFVHSDAALHNANFKRDNLICSAHFP